MVEPPHYGLEKANASRDSGTNSVVQHYKLELLVPQTLLNFVLLMLMVVLVCVC